MARRKADPHAALTRMMDAHAAYPARTNHEPLRPVDEMLILALDKADYGRMDISRIAKASPMAVARCLETWDDTRTLARKRLDSKALEMTDRFIAEAEPPEILKVLGKLDVVRDDKSQDTGGGVQIIIGVPGQSHVSLAPPVIDVKAI